MAMRIGEAAKAAGLKVETVRFYEAEGLIGRAVRSDGNYRLYDQAQVERLAFIRRSRDLGFALDQVRALLRISDDPDAPCEEIDRIAASNLAEVDRKLADLRVLRRELTEIIDGCGGPDVARCRIIEALSPPH